MQKSSCLCLLLLATGCALDPRPQALRRGMDQVRSVLADPRLRTLLVTSPAKTLEEQLVDAMFSSKARRLWPPRLAEEVDFSIADQSRLPGRIAYLRQVDLPWAVVVKADAQSHKIRLLGYGKSLREPILQDAVTVNR